MKEKYFFLGAILLTTILSATVVYLIIPKPVSYPPVELSPQPEPYPSIEVPSPPTVDYDRIIQDILFAIDHRPASIPEQYKELPKKFESYQFAMSDYRQDLINKFSQLAAETKTAQKNNEKEKADSLYQQLQEFKQQIKQFDSENDDYRRKVEAFVKNNLRVPLPPEPKVEIPKSIAENQSTQGKKRSYEKYANLATAGLCIAQPELCPFILPILMISKLFKGSKEYRDKTLGAISNIISGRNPSEEEKRTIQELLAAEGANGPLRTMLKKLGQNSSEEIRKKIETILNEKITLSAIKPQKSPELETINNVLTFNPMISCQDLLQQLGGLQFAFRNRNQKEAALHLAQERGASADIIKCLTSISIAGEN